MMGKYKSNTIRKALWRIWIIALFTPIWAYAESHSYDGILNELDEVIARKHEYRAKHEQTIAQLKQQLVAETDNAEKYKLCGELFKLYLHYQADSALHYVEEKQKYASAVSDEGIETTLIINRADAMGVMGAYNEALTELQKINRQSITPELLLSYYYALRTYYGWMADYTIVNEEKQKYIEKTACYRDSVLLLVPEGASKSISLAEKMILDSQAEQAIPILNKALSEPLDMREKAYVNYTLALVYETKNDVDMQIYYLAQTAILDLTASVREYASLQKLARVLYQQGNIERAYEYLSCSMEDAVACNARLRFLEVTEYYPIIDQAYSEKEVQEKRMGWILFLTVSILAVALVILALYLHHGMKNLSLVRQNLSHTNEKLKAANENLEQTGKIKEVYIARYLDRCVSYLNKLEQYRRSLEKLAMASRIEELFKAIRSEQFLRDERKNFYTEFDKSFLELFPNFIEDFNNLLAEDARIYPKPNELLNTELRIFALIRLGVTDANSIAHFLGYSLATVYNYRSKIRNRAKGDKDRFELEVMKL